MGKKYIRSVGIERHARQKSSLSVANSEKCESVLCCIWRRIFYVLNSGEYFNLSHKKIC